MKICLLLDGESFYKILDEKFLKKWIEILGENRYTHKD